MFQSERKRKTNSNPPKRQTTFLIYIIKCDVTCYVVVCLSLALFTKELYTHVRIYIMYIICKSSYWFYVLFDINNVGTIQNRWWLIFSLIRRFFHFRLVVFFGNFCHFRWTFFSIVCPMCARPHVFFPPWSLAGCVLLLSIHWLAIHIQHIMPPKILGELFYWIVSFHLTKKSARFFFGVCCCVSWISNYLYTTNNVYVKVNVMLILFDSFVLCVFSMIRWFDVCTESFFRVLNIHRPINLNTDC